LAVGPADVALERPDTTTANLLAAPRRSDAGAQADHWELASRKATIAVEVPETGTMMLSAARTDASREIGDTGR
jgi:hypothetical protein